jgi:hypothetical protein
MLGLLLSAKISQLYMLMKRRSVYKPSFRAEVVGYFRFRFSENMLLLTGSITRVVNSVLD